MTSGFELGEMSMMTQAVTPSEQGKPIEVERDADHIGKGSKDCSSADAGSRSSGAVAVNPAEQNTGQNAFIFHLSGGKEIC